MPANGECQCTTRNDGLYDGADAKYSDPTNTSLLQCPHCGQIADVFQSLPRPVLLLNLLLLKPQPFRHILRNRGGDRPDQRHRYRNKLALKLALVVVGADALVRWAGAQTENELQALRLFAGTFGYCLLETVSLLLCIAAASVILIPLTAFCASIPTIFFLIVSSVIWRQEYLADGSGATDVSTGGGAFAFLSPIEKIYRQYAHDPQQTAMAQSPLLSYLASYSRANLRSGLAQVGAAKGWASEALLRKGIGGTSLLVACSVLFRTSKRQVLLILILAWLFHLVVLHAADPFLS
ncbi:hypothetical protein RHOSPDRAFT_32867 [Rhodotorula sp. JG-1b]|nr:hypothetical protein RHOSPDRAFT_32867 [Rhodotorula sp. JG-1b]